MKPITPSRAQAGRQKGAATLVVVMVLFFLMAMMAAFANRNLIFEQRIASNYYRSGVAFEAAEAGVEWTLALLNGSNIDQTCTASASSTASNFRQIYITKIDPATGIITPPVTDPISTPIEASCTRLAGTSQGWSCTCPAAGTWVAPSIAAPPSTQPGSMQPSFGVSVTPANELQIPNNVVTIKSLGCSGSNPANCLQANSNTAAADQILGASVVYVNAALLSALKMPPVMPLTVQQTVVDGTSSVGLHNTDPKGNGLLLLAGGNVPALTLSDSRLDSLPGTPGQVALVSNDPGLSGATVPGTMFASFFGMSPTQYQNQPAMRTVTNCGSDCATTLQPLYATGVRMVWIPGDVTLSSLTLGTAASPMVIVATGNVTINGPVTLNGLLYAFKNITVNPSGQASINGAVIIEGTLTATAAIDITYQSSIINALSKATGSFVRLPGSWLEGTQ